MAERTFEEYEQIVDKLIRVLATEKCTISDCDYVLSWAKRKTQQKTIVQVSE